MTKNMKTKTIKSKKVSKKEVKENKEEILGQIQETEQVKEEVKPRDFIYGDFITDTHTAKTFIYHGQNSVKENLDRYILIAPNL